MFIVKILKGEKMHIAVCGLLVTKVCFQKIQILNSVCKHTLNADARTRCNERIMKGWKRAHEFGNRRKVTVTITQK